jgi:hypothetical protein
LSYCWSMCPSAKAVILLVCVSFSRHFVLLLVCDVICVSNVICVSKKQVCILLI